VSAQDKASGKVQKITITSDKGRLSEDEIERMLKEAEDNAESDKLARQTVEAKNQLESYLYSLRSTLDEEAMKEKITGEDRENLTKVVTEALTWLEENSSADKDAFDEKRKEVEAVANPILTKVYAATAGSGSPPSEASSSSADAAEDTAGPTVEEADD
jgi:molecular chaperone DnaK (HSP70)